MLPGRIPAFSTSNDWCRKVDLAASFLVRTHLAAQAWKNMPDRLESAEAGDKGWSAQFLWSTPVSSFAPETLHPYLVILDPLTYSLRSLLSHKITKNGVFHSSVRIDILQSLAGQPKVIPHGITNVNNLYWLVVWTPLKNISQLGWLFPIYGKIKNVPNHQPV